MKRRARYAAMLVGCVGLAATLSVAGGGFEPLGSDKAAVLEDQRVQLFSLIEIIEPAASDPLLAPVVTPVASVLTVVEAVIAAAREEGDPPARVTFHDESGLLILRAEEAEIAAVREALELIRLDIRRVRQDVANQDRTRRTGIVETVVDIDPARRAELEATLRMAMIAVEKARLEIDSRQETLDEAYKRAQAGVVGKGEIRELRSAYEHARLAMHDSATKAEILQHQLESLGGGAEGAKEAREAEAAGELRMAFHAIERAQIEMAAREAAFAEARALGASGFGSERELREHRVAFAHARLNLQQAEVLASHRQIQMEAAKNQAAAATTDEDVATIAKELKEMAEHRQVLIRSIVTMRAKEGEYDEQHEQELAQRLAWSEQKLALLQSRLVEANEVAAQRSVHEADELAMAAELSRRLEQLARVEAEVAAAHDREAAVSREMIEHTTRLEVRLEETQRVLERKHAECADLSDHLREMMVRVEVEAVRRRLLEEEVQGLREALERGKE